MDEGFADGDHPDMRRRLPSATVTFLFTDVEGSTQLLHELGAEAYAEALAEHRRVLREVFAAEGGAEVDTQGDAFLYVFTDARAAVAAVGAANAALEAGLIRIRSGLHTGEALVTEEGYVGEDVHLGARVAAAGHGGQVLLSAATRALLDGGVTDLGEHRLKDFAEPVWLFQLGNRPFPPLKTISNTNLPVPVTSFVGREAELSQAEDLLASTRLLTVTGPGGTGKTRFAVELASRRLGAFEHGIFWVPLAPLRDSAVVMETAGQTVGARGLLAGHIADRRMLLVFDNFEHVVDAAVELGALLAACPNLTVIVTSRELLRLQGETEYALPPLEGVEGVTLFCERARLENTPAVEELCRRLDSLPLAIELAAASTRLLSPEQLLARLGRRLDLLKGGRDADARQRTLRATIAWSYDLLAPDEQALLARLSVFVGGWTLEAAEAVCDAEVEGLLALLDKSLVRRSGDRYWMLETIREYAAEKLGDRETERLGRRHVEWFVALAEEGAVVAREAWSERLEADHANLRAAIDWTADRRDADTELRLVTALWQFWADRGYVAEGERRLDDALGRSDDQPAAARLGRCYLGSMTGRPFAGLLAEAKTLEADFAEQRDRFNRVRALVLIGVIELAFEATSAGEQALQEGLALANGDFPDEEAEATGWLLISALFGPLPTDQGIARCIDAYERAGHNAKVRAFALVERAPLEAMRGEFDVARKLLADGRAIFDELELKVFGVNTAHEAYFVHMLAGDPVAAAEELRAACEVLEELGERGFLSTNAGRLAHALIALGDLGGAEDAAELCASAAAADDLISQSLWRGARARALAARGETTRAIALAKEAAEMHPGDGDINARADLLSDLAEVLSVAGRANDAAAALREALELYEAKGNLVSAARTRAALAAR